MELIYPLLIICIGGADRYMATRIVSVETVLVYNLGGASSSK